MTQILWANTSALSDRGEDYPLSSYRLEKLRSQRLPAARRAGIGAELLLDRALRLRCPEAAVPPEIRCTSSGKPFLTDSALCFNLSHSGAYSACALSDAPVGLDIQTHQLCRKKLAECFFAPEERDYLCAAADRDSAFTELWCRKESFIKAVGLGLSMELRSFSAAPGAERLVWQGKTYRILSHCFPAFFLSVCQPERMDPGSVQIMKTELP